MRLEILLVIDITNVQLENHILLLVEGIRTGEVKDYSGNNHDATLDLTTTPQWTNIDQKVMEHITIMVPQM